MFSEILNKKNMVKRCVYCKVEIDQDSVVDVCRRCGIGVWGEKMFNAIIENMQGAKEAGDLYQGSVSTSPQKSGSMRKSGFGSLTNDAIATQNSKPVERQVDSFKQAPLGESLGPENEIKEEVLEDDSASFLIEGKRF